MGIADRDYYREPQRSGFLSRLTPVVKWLLLVNVAIFLIDYLVLPLALGTHPDEDVPLLVSWGAFSIPSAILGLRVWEFLSFQFLHDSLGHLLANSLGLFFFGPWAERWWGSRRFIVFYLLSGCGGAAFFALLSWLGVIPGGMEGHLIGASAGIYGVFTAVAVIAPNLRVMLLIPPIELSMRQLAMAALAISVGVIVIGFKNQGGEAGHLGGAIAGFLLMRFPGVLGMVAGPGGIRPAERPRHEPKLRPRSRFSEDSDSEVDVILDKISREGFQSLTPAEREILDRAARQNDTRP
jgi:membrane associated rhomboid family serine protease